MVLEADRLLKPSERLIVALDVADEPSALRLVDTLSPEVARFKVGLQLFCACGPDIVRKLVDRGARLFLDLKLHDIPNTVASALEACVQPGVFLIDVHAAGGRPMLRAARETVARAAEHRGIPAPALIGVTVLTHLSASDLEEVRLGPGGEQGPADQVRQLARLCQEEGLDGVVASPRELRVLRDDLGPGFLVVTPGIRPAGTEAHDQARTDTPTRALRAGASYLVVGRPITADPDPLAAARRIMREMEDAFLLA